MANTTSDGYILLFQILVEKLLRSCTEIEQIYILMRPKRGQEVAARLDDLLNSAVSDCDM